MRLDLVLRRRFALIAALVVTAVVAAPSPGASPVKTVVAFPGFPRNLALDAGRVAWIDTAWALRVRTLSTGAETKILYTNPYQEVSKILWAKPFEPSHALSERSGLALEGQHLLWISTRGRSLAGAG